MDSMIGHKVEFNYDINNPPVEQRLELIKIRYIDDSPHAHDNVYLHVYYSSDVYATEYVKTCINIPLNYANRYCFYIDYLYYNRAINECNEIILINKEYIIDVCPIGFKKRIFSSSIKEGDPKYNKDTHRIIYVNSEFVYDYEKYNSSIK